MDPAVLVSGPEEDTLVLGWSSGITGTSEVGGLASPASGKVATTGVCVVIVVPVVSCILLEVECRMVSFGVK